ncbi:MAG: ATP-dependent helicase, ATP-dependent helicase RecG [Candidatus Parcubacteria bacterium]|jgi:ATP-dependent DNA helicase RecG
MIELKPKADGQKLTASISSLSRLSASHKEALVRLTLETVEDLLYYFPTRYADLTEVGDSTTLAKGQAVTLYGEMDKVEVKRSFKGHVPMTTAYIKDISGRVRCIWFNQAYIGKMYPDYTLVRISGIVQEDSRGLFLSNPQIEKISVIPERGSTLFEKHIAIEDETSDKNNNEPSFLTPVYRETKGLTSLYLYTLIKKAIQANVLQEVLDPIPETIIKKLNLPSLRDALLYIHFPKNEELTIAARKRFAFQEIFLMQIKQQRERALANNALAYGIQRDEKALSHFMSQFNFSPTQAQVDAINGILLDMERVHPMGRLLEGDVGSGKTFVAACVSHQVVGKCGDNGQRLQVAYMAPTEILARQHFESFCDYFKNSNIEIGLLTGSACYKYPSKTDGGITTISKSQLSKWAHDGTISIVIGTHALIQKKVEFANLALIIIDEQHRFGVKQRKLLAKKKNASTSKLPHLLSMTATPIPRTLALTMFGDLDLTVLDAMPLERKKIETRIISSLKRPAIYEHIRGELRNGRQVYVICPRIDEQDEEEKQKRTLKSVNEEAKRLSEEIFPEFIVDIIHSKMKKEDKEEVMRDFLEKRSDILVATSVVEVGVNVPNATVIIIEHAERFGLAQLHQLRGRVGRGKDQSYCYLFTESESEMTMRRLKALVEAKNGFELAELDMKERGIGMLTDGKQWGISDMAMEAIKNPKLVEIARREAKALVEADSELISHPLLKQLTEEKESVHME